LLPICTEVSLKAAADPAPQRFVLRSECMISIKRTGTTAFQHVRKHPRRLPQHRRCTVVALALAAVVALLGVLAAQPTITLDECD
jgi:hypothetical protein